MTKTLTVIQPAQKSGNLVKRAFEPADAVAPVLDQIDSMTMAFHKGDTIDLVQLAELAENVRPIVLGDTDPKIVRAMAGIMLNGIPAARTFDSAEYLDLLVSMALAEPATEKSDFGVVYHRGGFSHVCVARAVRRVLRTATFTPAISEVLQAMRDERKQLSSIINGADGVKRMIEKRAEDAARREQADRELAERKRRQEQVQREPGKAETGDAAFLGP